MALNPISFSGSYGERSFYLVSKKGLTPEQIYIAGFADGNNRPAEDCSNEYKKCDPSLNYFTAVVSRGPRYESELKHAGIGYEEL